MPFDPTKPDNGAPVLAGQLRAQYNSINDDVQTRATQADLAAQIGGTSANSNAVATLDFVVSDPPQQGETQAILDKVNELINTLRR